MDWTTAFGTVLTGLVVVFIALILLILLLTLFRNIFGSVGHKEGEKPAPKPVRAPAPAAPAKPAPVSRAPQQPGGKKGIVNIDSLSRAFAPGDVVTVAAMQQRKLLKPGVGIVKVLARGTLDKPLIVEAHDFSLDAVKMILLTGGKVHRLHRSGDKEQ